MESPQPDFYLSVGSPVTCIDLYQNHTQAFLSCGLASGEVHIYEAANFQRIANIKAFKTGVLWLQFLDSDTLLCQGRFASLKVFIQQQQEESCNSDANSTEWSEHANFLISHEGFCKGLADVTADDVCLLFCPSSQSNVMICKLAERKYVRPIASLCPERQTEEKVGAIMAVAKADASRVLVAYESGAIWLWDWSNSSLLTTFNAISTGLKSPMSLAFDGVGVNHRFGLLVGAEGCLVSFALCSPSSDKEDGANNCWSLAAVRTRKIVNPGLGIVRLRPDRRIAVTGGWDGRIRVFSWKDPAKLKPLAVLDFHFGSVDALAFAERPLLAGRCLGKRLLIGGGHDGKLSFWSIY